MVSSSTTIHTVSYGLAFFRFIHKHIMTIVGPRNTMSEKEKNVPLIVFTTCMHAMWNVLVVVVNNYTLAMQARPQTGLSYTTSMAMFKCEQNLLFNVYARILKTKTMETVCGSFFGAPSIDDSKHAHYTCKKT